MTENDDPKPSMSEAIPADDPPESPPAPSAEELSDQLAVQRAESERFRDLYLRERAELENYKKRIQRDHSEALRYASTHLARDLAEVIDDLERAVEHAETGGNGKPLVEGVRLILRNALDVLGKHGITRIEAAGERFDPTRHEAIASVHAPEHEPNQVVQQFLPGYALHDRVIRPAKVSVASKGAVESPEGDD